MQSNLVSASIKIGPQDRRCRYWAIVVRSGDALPLPSAVNGANDIGLRPARNGEKELFAGDYLIEGETVHHVKARSVSAARGWRYRVRAVGDDGRERFFYPSAERKAAIQAAGCPPEWLPGSGDIASSAISWLSSWLNTYSIAFSSWWDTNVVWSVNKFIV